MSESAQDIVIRLRLMANGDETWDLSDNDCAAIRYALERITDLETNIVTARRILSKLSCHSLTIDCVCYKCRLMEVLRVEKS